MYNPLELRVKYWSKSHSIYVSIQYVFCWHRTRKLSDQHKLTEDQYKMMENVNCIWNKHWNKILSVYLGHIEEHIGPSNDLATVCTVVFFISNHIIQILYYLYIRIYKAGVVFANGNPSTWYSYGRRVHMFCVLNLHIYQLMSEIDTLLCLIGAIQTSFTVIVCHLMWLLTVSFWWGCFV